MGIQERAPEPSGLGGGVSCRGCSGRGGEGAEREGAFWESPAWPRRQGAEVHVVTHPCDPVPFLSTDHGGFRGRRPHSPRQAVPAQWQRAPPMLIVGPARPRVPRRPAGRCADPGLGRMGLTFAGLEPSRPQGGRKVR